MKNATALITCSAAVAIAAAVAAAVVLPLGGDDWAGSADAAESSVLAGDESSAPLVRVAEADPPATQPQSSPPSAQSAPSVLPAPAPPPAATAPPATPRPSAARQTDAEVVLTLVRSTMVALDQANESGNYTVLRDIGAPGFRDRNSAADLARIFAPIRDAKIDLSVATVLDPHISTATLNAQKQLHITGKLDTRPHPVAYELLYEVAGGRWRIFGISVTPITSIGVTSPPTTPAVAAKSARKRQPKAARSAAPNSIAPSPSVRDPK